MVALLCAGHILVEDVPGIGKTTLSKALAQSLGCTFKRIQFTPDLMPNDVVGVNFFNQRTSEFEFRPGPIVSQVLLADEINHALYGNHPTHGDHLAGMRAELDAAMSATT
jgi:MoxR-like ATPase